MNQEYMHNQPASASHQEALTSSHESRNDLGFHIDLERYWIEARGLRYWLAGIIAFALLIGLVVTLISTEMFRATARIEISQIAANVTDIDPLENDSRISELQYLNTQYELLESRFMATRVAEAGNLLRDELFLKTFKLSEHDKVTERDIQEALLDNISIEPIAQSSLVDIQFSSSSPTVSAKIANLWAEEFIAANYEKRFGANIEARDFLNKQIEELRERLSISEKELVDYANANEILVLENGDSNNGGEGAAQTLIATDLTALNEALAQAVADRITAQAGVVAGDFPSNDQRNQLRTELIKAEAELAALRANFGPGFPPLIEKEAQVKSLRASISDEARSALRSASLREAELRKKLEEAKSSFLGQQDLGIQYGILKREVDTNRTLYEALLQRFKELEASGAGQNNIKLIDTADVPTQPYAPSLVQNMLIALVAGLVLSASLVYLRVTLSQTLKDPQDVDRRLGLPLLGMIPKSTSGDIADEVITRSSELSEAYNSARTNLTFLTPTGAPRALMLTSSVPSEGKSISSLALATSFSRLGKRTLLIDADLRNSRMVGILGDAVGKKGGLAALLTGNANALPEQTVALEAYGFDYLPHGHTPPNPVELLASTRFRELLDEARQSYDQVIIDSAPMLSLADAVEISRVADGVVYVIEADRIKLSAIENAINRLRRTGAPVYGAIVTKLDSNAAGYGYGYRYGYGYGYGAEAVEKVD